MRLAFDVVGYFLAQAAAAEFGVGSIRASLYLSIEGVLKGVSAAGESAWAVWVVLHSHAVAAVEGAWQSFLKV